MTPEDQIDLLTEELKDYKEKLEAAIAERDALQKKFENAESALQDIADRATYAWRSL